MSGPDGHSVAVHIRRRDGSAGGAFVSQALATRVLALQGSFDCDIDGALDAGQYGMAFVAVRSALHQALFVYLAREGNVSALPTDVSNQVYELLAAHDSTGHVLEQGWRLECMNPLTPAEVQSFAEQFRRFANDVLGLDKMAMYSTLLSDSEYGRYLEFEEEMSTIFDHLGMQGINLPESHRRVERRGLVNANLRDEAPARCVPATPRDASPGQDAGADAGDDAGDMHLTLTRDDVRALAHCLPEEIAALKERIAHTDGRDERRVLLTRQTLWERLLAQVETASVL